MGERVLYRPHAETIIFEAPFTKKRFIKEYHCLCKSLKIGGAPNLHFPHLHQTQIYISHIYTEPRFTQTQIYTNPDLHQTQIYTALHWHTQIYTTQIYTKLNPNLHRPKFTQAQIYIHIFGQISNNPNLHNPNLHKTQIYTTQIYATQIYTQPKFTHNSKLHIIMYVSNRVRFGPV